MQKKSQAFFSKNAFHAGKLYNLLQFLLVSILFSAKTEKAHLYGCAL